MSGEANVYVIRHELGPVKIGLSTSPTSRCGQLQTACPFKVYLEGVIRCSDANTVEKLLHGHFEEWQIRGEWFDLPASKDAWLGSLYFLEGERLQIELESGPNEYDEREIKQALIG